MKKTGLVRLLSKNSILFLALLIIISLSFDSNAQGMNQFSGNANLILGYKILNQDDWDLTNNGIVKLDEHFEWGVDVDFKMKNWPISINSGYLRSFEEKTVATNDNNVLEEMTSEAKTSEFYIGVKKIIEQLAPVYPYVNGGLTRTKGELLFEYSNNGVSTDESYDDSAFGFYIGGGIYYTLMNHLNMGVNVRYSRAEVSLYGKDRAAGGIHYGLMVGYHF